MSKWPEIALGEICQIIGGATPRTSEPSYWGGEVEWVTPKDLARLGSHYITSTPRKLTDDGLKSCGAILLPRGSVLFSSRAPIGHVAINTVPMATNQGFKSLVPHKELVDAKYLYHWLKTNQRYLQSLGNGATFKEVSKKIVSGVTIPLPPLEEQRRIAAILDKADELRAGRREAIAKLDTLAQSIFIEMFGDPVTNPMGWTKRKFGEICDSRLGKMLDKKQQTGEHIRPYLRNQNIRWFSIELSDLQVMDFDEKDRLIFDLRPGDVMICEGGEPGRAAVWAGQLEDCYFQKALHRARPNDELVRSEYLVWVLWFLSRGGGLSDHITSATIAHLTGVKLKNVEMIIPPVALQKQFVDRINAVESIRQSHNKWIENGENLFASLQQRAFAGEL